MNGLEYLYVDLARREVLSSVAGDLKTFQNFIAGQKVRFALRFLERLSNGDLSEVDLTVLSLRVGLGRIDARPDSGTYRIQIGEGPRTPQNTTRDIEWNDGAIEVEEALNALPMRPADFLCNEEAGALSIRRVDGEDVFLSVHSQGLKPLSSGLIERVRISGVSTYHLRLIQLPVSFTDSSERVLPKAPSIATLQNGGSEETDQSIRYWNEIQELTIPADFRGAFQFRKPDTYKRSAVLDSLAGIQEIQTALNEMLRDEGGVVKVTNPKSNVANIEFGTLTPGLLLSGFQGRDVPELVIEVFSSPPGAYTFDLDLSTAGLADLLRDNESVTVPFEAEALVYKDPSNPSGGVVTVKLWSTEATIRRSLLWAGLANEAPLGWQDRIVPRDYLPFTRDQLLVGQQQAVVRLVSGGESIIDHGLAGAESEGGVVAVVVREAANGGVQLADSYYTIHHTTKNSLRLRILESAYLTTHVGDGVTVNFGVSHPAHVPLSAYIRQNNGQGGFFWSPVPAGNYSVLIGVVRFDVAPGVGSVIAVGGIPPSQHFAVSIIGYGPESRFQAHTHALAQIQGLQQFLDGLTQRVSLLESLAPRGGITVTSNVSKKRVEIPSFGEILPDLAVESSDGVSIASQMAGSAVISGTNLEAQQREQQAAALRIKAEDEAKTQAAQEAAAIAAVQVKVKAVQDAAQKSTNVISKIAIAQFGTISETTTNTTTTTTTSAGTATTVTPVTVKTVGPTMYPVLRGGRYPMLLPALHTDQVRDVSSVPALATAAGIVYRNAGSLPLVLPAGGGRKAQSVLAGEYFGGDGRALYALRRAGTTTSYHPTEMERELVRVVVRASQFPESSILSLAWQLELSFLTSTLVAGAGYVMGIEASPLPDDLSPATTGVNVGAVGEPVLLAAPRISFSRGAAETRQFAVKLARLRVDGVLKGSSRCTDYGVESIGPEIPGGDFLLTIRLLQWDVDDSTPVPTGQVGVLMPATQMTVEQTV
jgi:hypothetical protein